MFISQIIYFGFASLCLAYALWRGGSPERLLGGIAMAASIVSPLLVSRQLYQHWEGGVWLTDTVVFLAMLAVATAANRYWPIWIAAIQLCGVLTHFGAVLDRHLLPSAYYVMTAYGAYVHWAIMVLGTARHRTRMRRYAEDPPWRRSQQASAVWQAA